MTEICIEREKHSRFQVVFSIALLVAFSSAVLYGFKLETIQNVLIMPRSLFKELSFFEGAVKLCIWDMVAFWLITISLSPALRIVFSSLLFMIRGIITGNALQVFFVNSISREAVLILASYATVTLLLLIYDCVLNAFGKKDLLCRIFSCLLVTGAAAIIRIFPVILL